MNAISDAIVAGCRSNQRPYRNERIKANNHGLALAHDFVKASSVQVDDARLCWIVSLSRGVQQSATRQQGSQRSPRHGTKHAPDKNELEGSLHTGTFRARWCLAVIYKTRNNPNCTMPVVRPKSRRVINPVLLAMSLTGVKDAGADPDYKPPPTINGQVMFTVPLSLVGWEDGAVIGEPWIVVAVCLCGSHGQWVRGVLALTHAVRKYKISWLTL